MSRFQGGLIFILCALLLAACKKENDRPQWDIALLGPVAKGSLGISNLTNDTLLRTNADSSITLVYNKSFYSLVIDSLFKIPDTVVTTMVPPTLVPFPIPVSAGAVIYDAVNETKLTVSNVQLRSAIVKTGKARFMVRNRLHTKVNFTYTIPGALLNGEEFTISAVVDSATASGPGIYRNVFDLAGYYFDLSGTTGGKVNAISYKIKAVADPDGPNASIATMDTGLVIQNGFEEIVPYYAKGYLGQTTLNVADSTSLDLFENVKGGTLSLEEAKLTLAIENDIGMDAQLHVGNITSVNAGTATSVALSAPSIINQTLNINRAGATGTKTNPGYIPSYYAVTIDNSNSNFKALLENLPSHLVYSIDLQTNPLGNVSGSNDFAFADHLVNVNLNMEIPLNLSANQLTLKDTTEFSLGGDSSVNSIGSGALIFNVDNGFPFQVKITLTTLDTLNNGLDNLILNGVAEAPALDGNLKAIGKRRTQFVIPVDEARVDLIRKARKMVVTAAYTTVAGSQHVRIYSNYAIDYKLIADINYHVR